jgi:hypothetical protein
MSMRFGVFWAFCAALLLFLYMQQTAIPAAAATTKNATTPKAIPIMAPIPILILLEEDCGVADAESEAPATRAVAEDAPEDAPVGLADAVINAYEAVVLTVVVPSPKSLMTVGIPISKMRICLLQQSTPTAAFEQQYFVPPHDTSCAQVPGVSVTKFVSS